MKVKLADIQPNPFRDFTVDPIIEENVDKLVASIEDDGYWGGIVCRKVGKIIQYAAGHHRGIAALKTGIMEADVHVGNFDDAAMIRIYTRENALQRGNSGSAVAGSIAAAIRFLAKAILSGDKELLVNSREDISIEDLRGNLQSDRGLGQPLISSFLGNVPGLDPFTVREQLANLKASGDYHRIIREVIAQIEALKQEQAAKWEDKKREAERTKLRVEEAERKLALAKERADKAAQEEAEEARRLEEDIAARLKKELEVERKQFEQLRKVETEKAAAVVENPDVTFDLNGVSNLFENESQLRTFRTLVTGQYKDVIPVEKQAEIAREIIRLSKKHADGLSASYIRLMLGDMVNTFKNGTRKLTKEEQEKIEKEHTFLKWNRLNDEFDFHVRSLIETGTSMLHLMEKNRDLKFRFKGKQNLQLVQGIVEKLVSKL